MTYELLRLLEKLGIGHIRCMWDPNYGNGQGREYYTFVCTKRKRSYEEEN